MVSGAFQMFQEVSGAHQRFSGGLRGFPGVSRGLRSVSGGFIEFLQMLSRGVSGALQEFQRRCNSFQEFSRSRRFRSFPRVFKERFHGSLGALGWGAGWYFKEFQQLQSCFRSFQGV